MSSFTTNYWDNLSSYDEDFADVFQLNEIEHQDLQLSEATSINPRLLQLSEHELSHNRQAVDGSFQDEVSSPPDKSDSTTSNGLQTSGSGARTCYAVYIYRALASTKPDYEMTLQNIYAWYRKHVVDRGLNKSGDSQWKVSIRHNLAQNKDFIKGGRSPVTDPKKNTWGLSSEAIKRGRVDPTAKSRAATSTSPLSHRSSALKRAGAECQRAQRVNGQNEPYSSANFSPAVCANPLRATCQSFVYDECMPGGSGLPYPVTDSTGTTVPHVALPPPNLPFTGHFSDPSYTYPVICYCSTQYLLSQLPFQAHPMRYFQNPNCRFREPTSTDLSEVFNDIDRSFYYHNS